MIQSLRSAPVWLISNVRIVGPTHHGELVKAIVVETMLSKGRLGGVLGARELGPALGQEIELRQARLSALSSRGLFAPLS